MLVLEGGEDNKDAEPAVAVELDSVESIVVDVEGGDSDATRKESEGDEVLFSAADEVLPLEIAPGDVITPAPYDPIENLEKDDKYKGDAGATSPVVG